MKEISQQVKCGVNIMRAKCLKRDGVIAHACAPFEMLAVISQHIRMNEILLPCAETHEGMTLFRPSAPEFKPKLTANEKDEGVDINIEKSENHNRSKNIWRKPRKIITNAEIPAQEISKHKNVHATLVKKWCAEEDHDENEVSIQEDIDSEISDEFPNKQHEFFTDK